jgi:hypothetical protein
MQAAPHRVWVQARHHELGLGEPGAHALLHGLLDVPEAGHAQHSGLHRRAALLCNSFRVVASFPLLYTTFSSAEGHSSSAEGQETRHYAVQLAASGLEGEFRHPTGYCHGTCRQYQHITLVTWHTCELMAGGSWPRLGGLTRTWLLLRASRTLYSSVCLEART